jgi:uncharacterized protein YbjT (DUF2867 family)
MNVNRVCLLGGSGFVGRHVAHALARRGCEIRVLARDRERAKELLVLPTVDVVTANVNDPTQLSKGLRGMDAVISLVGILHQTHGARFEQVHVGLARSVIHACEVNNVRRLLHMSALNANPSGPSAYLRSKGEAEKLVREFGANGNCAVTTFRPSVIFGPGDSFLSLFAKLINTLPVIALACPNARFQPIYVEDVATVFASSLDNPETFGASFDLCGPKVYSLRDLVEFTAQVIGKRRPIVGLGPRLSYLQALAMELLPTKLLTRDNYYSMQVDSVCECAFPAVFGFHPAAMEAIVAGYLGGGSSRRRYHGLRYRAGR